MSSCYIDWKESKTGELIPLFSNGTASFSLYNPKRDAEQFSNLVEVGTTVIAGLANGMHILEAEKKYPNNKIIVIEKNNETIEFLTKKIAYNFSKNTIITTIKNLNTTLIQNYYPPIDGNFQLLPLRSWLNANSEDFEVIKKIVKKTLDSISRDISVQAHFGKVWQRNIIQNLKICESINTSHLLNFFATKFPTNKIAYIAGAGPSLEDDFELLKENKNKYYIIATDTAYHSLKKQNIECDVVVSVDAQFISHSHFIGKHNSKTIFAFDLCSNSIPVKKVAKTNTILFFKSNHPLCTLIDNFYFNKTNKYFFPLFESTGGTVTLAALDFANKAGFTTIKTGGCDFCYSKGKMYTKDIYMDEIFNAESNKINPTEKLFSKIQFRSELIPLNNNKTTTSTLQVYKQSYDNFFEQLIPNPQNHTELIKANYTNSFPTNEFLTYYKEKLHELVKKASVQPNEIYFSILPYLSWYSYKSLKTRENFDFLLKTTIQSICLML